MRAGLLTEIISFYSPYTGETKYGRASKQDYIPTIKETRARVLNQRGTRQNENNEMVYSYTVTFIVRGYHKIDEYMRIFWRGKFYRILNIMPPERDRNEYQIDTELVNE